MYEAKYILKQEGKIKIFVTHLPSLPHKQHYQVTPVCRQHKEASHFSDLALSTEYPLHLAKTPPHDPIPHAVPIYFHILGWPCLAPKQGNAPTESQLLSITN